MRTTGIAFSLLLLATLVSLPLAAQSKGTILIASENTGFKKALVAELETLFSSEGYTVVKATHSKGWGDRFRASDYAAVFITNSGVNSKVRPWVTEWIAKNRDAKTYILLHTTQIRDWKVETDVDAVTSASTKEEAKSLAREYFLRITGMLAKRGPIQ